jgi:drug/metabolite transporter (DMT)-like permease
VNTGAQERQGQANRADRANRVSPPSEWMSARKPLAIPARTLAALAAIVLFWGANYPVVKFALRDVAPLVFTTLRFVLASAVLWGAVTVTGTSIRIPWRQWGPVAGLALVGTTVNQAFFVFGLRQTLAGNAALILASAPVFTAVLAVTVRQERSTRRTWAGVALSVTGAGLLVLGSTRGVGLSAGTVTGDLLLLAGAVVWSIYTVGTASLARRHGAIPLTAVTMWIGTAGLLAITAPALWAQDWTAIRAATWAAVLYSGTCSIGVAYFLWAYCLRQIGSTRTVVFSNVTPVVALALAWLTLAEVPTLLQMVGGASILAGSLVVTLRPSPA